MASFLSNFTLSFKILEHKSFYFCLIIYFLCNTFHLHILWCSACNIPPFKKITFNYVYHSNIPTILTPNMGGILKITVCFSHHASILHLSIHHVSKRGPDILKLRDIVLWDVTFQVSQTNVQWHNLHPRFVMLHQTTCPPVLQRTSSHRHHVPIDLGDHNNSHYSTS